MIELTEKEVQIFQSNLKPKITKEQQHEENKKELGKLYLTLISLEAIKPSLTGEEMEEYRRIHNRTRHHYEELKFTVEAYDRNIIRQQIAERILQRAGETLQII